MRLVDGTAKVGGRGYLLKPAFGAEGDFLSSEKGDKAFFKQALKARA